MPCHHSIMPCCDHGHSDDMDDSPPSDGRAELQELQRKFEAHGMPPISASEFRGFMEHMLHSRDKKPLNFRDHFSEFATVPATNQSTTTVCKLKPSRRKGFPHYSPGLSRFGTPEQLAFFKGDVTGLPMPAPDCRCNLCTGYRFHAFLQDLRAYTFTKHVRECGAEGKRTCGFFCPYGDGSLFNSSPVTAEHLLQAEKQGFKLDVILAGYSDYHAYRPDNYEVNDLPLLPPYQDMSEMLTAYKSRMHSPKCNPSKPCASCCFKPGAELTESEIAAAKKMFPHWQQRMLLSEGMDQRTRMEKEMQKAFKVQRKRAKREKVAYLSRPENCWSEAPLELGEYLGCLPPVHQPTCCFRVPCVSRAVCFPEGRDGGL